MDNSIKLDIYTKKRKIFNLMFIRLKVSTIFFRGI
jgi:hypothetical protein